MVYKSSPLPPWDSLPPPVPTETNNSGLIGSGSVAKGPLSPLCTRPHIVTAFIGPPWHSKVKEINWIFSSPEEVVPIGYSCDSPPMMITLFAFFDVGPQSCTGGFILSFLLFLFGDIHMFVNIGTLIFSQGHMVFALAFTHGLLFPFPPPPSWSPYPTFKTCRHLPSI